MNKFRLILSVVTLCLLLLGGCAQTPPTDYTEFRKAAPRSILILPPINNSSEILAGNSFSSWSPVPIAERGYYVFPVALTTETFRQNGVTEPTDIHAIPIEKLYEIFGADSAMYITIERYGTHYVIFASQTEIKANARLVDLRTGKELWKGEVYAKDGGSSQGSPLAMLINGAVKQVISSVSNRAHSVLAKPAAYTLYLKKNHGLLRGPYLPEEKTK